MARRAKLAVGAIFIAALLSLPAAALAVFPGENGKILFVSGRGGPPNDDSSSDVYIMNGPNAPALPLTTADGQHRHPNWSPDLKTVAYARWATATDEKVWIDDLADSGPQDRLGIGASNVRDDRPAWSPNGKRIAYESEVADGSGQMDILITNVKTRATVNLTDTDNMAGTDIEGKPVWSPDGKYIYYHSNRFGDQDIFREKADNSQAIPTSIIGSAGNQFQPALSPDGSELCYTQGSFSNDADVFKRTVSSSGTPEEISDETVTVADYNCAWSPEGDKIAYVTGLLTAGALVYKNSDDTGNPTLLTTDTPMHFDGNPDWAPKRPAFCNGKPATIAGTDGRDVIRGTMDRDIIVTHKGNDFVTGQAGNDLICGRAGDDKLKGGTGNDKLIGGAGDDLLKGGPDRDICRGGPGKDHKTSCEK